MKNCIALAFLLALVVCFAVPSFAASDRVPAVPPGLAALPADGISCLSVEIDGGQFYHVDFEKPAHTAAEVEAHARKLSADLRLRGLVTGEPRVQSDAVRLADAVANSKDYVVGAVCYVLRVYCAPSCTGQGCATIRVPSIQ